MFQRIACCALSSPRSSMSARRPEAVEPLPLFGEDRVGAVGLGAAERARAAVGELLGGTPVDEWYVTSFVMRIGSPGCGARR